MVPALNSAKRRRLRAEAHRLAPLAQVGRHGVSDAFVAELDRALSSHELIKVRLRGERSERAAELAEVSNRLECAVVGTVGSVAILYRPTPDEENGAAEARS